MEHLPALLCVLLTAVLVWGEANNRPTLRAISKTGAASAFIVYALVLGAWQGGAAPRWIVLGLCLSMVGDLALLSRDKRFFLGGLVAFLLAHVAYVGAFVTLGMSASALAVVLLPLTGFAYGVHRWLSPHTGELGRPVIAYIIVITAMVACSIGALAASPSPARWGLLAAAVLFFFSDLCVARDRFVAPGWNNRMVGLPLYFGAQLVFAYFGAAVT